MGFYIFGVIKGRFGPDEEGKFAFSTISNLTFLTF
jgi:hypothetical protein